MAYISYNNVVAFVSTGDSQSLNTATYNRLFATNFSANNSTNLQRIKRLGQENDYYNQTGPKSSSINVTVVPVTGTNSNQVTGFLALTGDFVSGSYVQVPSYRFDKCFLKNFSINFEPWKVSSANMQFDSYGLAGGAGISSQTPSTIGSGIISPLRGSSISITNSGPFTGPITEYENAIFEVSVDRAANYEIGSEYPTKVSVARITKNLQINGISNLNWISDYQPNQVMNFSITMADGNSISVNGIVNSQSFSVDANGVAKTNLTVVEEMV